MLYGVRDLDEAAERFRREHGWTVGSGGSPEPGVVNRIVALRGALYVELVAAADPSASPGAARIAEHVADGDRWFTWALEPETPAEFDTEAARLGLPVSGSDADTGSWRVAGRPEPERPFLIDYGVSRAERAPRWDRRHADADHENPPTGITFVEVGGDEAAVRAWLGTTDADVRCVGGPPGLRSVGIETARGEVIVR